MAARKAEKPFGTLPEEPLLKFAREAHDKVLKGGRGGAALVIVRIHQIELISQDHNRLI